MSLPPDRRLADRPVGLVALGTAMPSLRGDDAGAFRSVTHATLDAGVRVLDGAAAYVPDAASAGFSERLIARAIGSWGGPREQVVHVVKVGHRRVADGADGLIVDGRPESLRADVEHALRAVGADRLDLVLLHLPDPAVPLADSFGALIGLQQQGLIRDVGLSNVRLAQVDGLRGTGVVAAVENQYSFAPRALLDGLPVTRAESDPVLAWCRAHGALFLAYSPLGGSASAVEALGRRCPALQRAAQRRGISPARAALAWLIARHEVLLPISGATRRASALDSAAAAQVVLEPDEVAAIDVELRATG